MRQGEVLLKFLARLMLDKLHGSVTIKFEHGKVTHVQQETRRHRQYSDLPGEDASLHGVSYFTGER